MSLTVQLQKIGIALTRLLPVKVADRIADGLGMLFCYASRTKREYIQNNVRHIFHREELEPEQRVSYVKKTFKNFARSMTDFFRLAYITRDDFNIDCVGFDNAFKALELNRGCVLITLHLGNWDYAGAFLAAHGVPMNALVEVTEGEMFRLYTRHREHTGMKTFPVNRAGYAFLDTIKRNRVLALLADRDIMKNGITVDFFSGKRKIPRGLGDIIIKKKIPVLFAYLVFHPTSTVHRYLGCVEPPVVFDCSIDEFNRVLVKKMEGFIRTYPDQWFVFHPEWIEET